jgi:hypothetical protein
MGSLLVELAIVFGAPAHAVDALAGGKARRKSTIGQRTRAGQVR